ncbi:hypothetical protein XELAEV_18020911mg [Xenopus laevis]|uniref:Uncharacterized protein n=1 Tax=Xenopus laevis TaxID=8355 RepID=A0A974HRF0_XENLA|nr:hypothetical protein XELAEV_18020911mg [Xenopus laevis]
MKNMYSFYGKYPSPPATKGLALAVPKPLLFSIIQVTGVPLLEIQRSTREWFSGTIKPAGSFLHSHKDLLTAPQYSKFSLQQPPQPNAHVSLLPGPPLQSMLVTTYVSRGGHAAPNHKHRAHSHPQ